jgi:hypothetical protein
MSLDLNFNIFFLTESVNRATGAKLRLLENQNSPIPIQPHLKGLHGYFTSPPDGLLSEGMHKLMNQYCVSNQNVSELDTKYI